MTKIKDAGYNSDFNLLRNCINKTISEMAISKYYFNAQEDKNYMNKLELKFTDESNITLWHDEAGMCIHIKTEIIESI